MFDISGFVQAKSICDVRVHICEVDRIRWIIWRIPDYIIDKARLELVNPEGVPHPIGPDPGPEERRMATRSFTMEAAPAHGFTAAKSVQTMTRRLPSTLSSQLANASINDVRNLIVEHFALLHPIFCLYRW